MTASTGPPAGFAFSLAGGVEAGQAARRAVLAADGAVPPSVRGDVLLLVTELVTNAVRHAGVGPDGSLRVQVRRQQQRLRVEVADPGDGFDLAPVRPAPHGAGGWGLVLVERIADSWGIVRGAGGTCVWFELLTDA